MRPTSRALILGLVSMLGATAAQSARRSGLRLVEGTASRPVHRGDEASDRWYVTSFSRCLFDRSKLLGCGAWFSVSPSGRFVLFETDTARHLYDRESRVITTVDSCPLFPGPATWSEVQRTVIVSGSAAFGCEEQVVVKLPK